MPPPLRIGCHPSPTTSVPNSQNVFACLQDERLPPQRLAYAAPASQAHFVSPLANLAYKMLFNSEAFEVLWWGGGARDEPPSVFGK